MNRSAVLQGFRPDSKGNVLERARTRTESKEMLCKLIQVQMMMDRTRYARTEATEAPSLERN